MIVLYAVALYLFLCLFAWTLPDPMNRRQVRASRDYMAGRNQTIHTGSPTNLRFEGSKVYDRNGNELHPVPFKKWVEQNENR